MDLENGQSLYLGAGIGMFLPGLIRKGIREQAEPFLLCLRTA